MFEICFRPDWQEHLWSLDTKGSSGVLLFPARPLWGRAQMEVQSALRGEVTSG